MNTKEQITASVEAAKAELEQALEKLHHLPALDWSAVRYAAHALGNYLNITSACVQLMEMSLAEHPDADVHTLLQTLTRTTDLMTFVARHLTHASTANEVPLLREEVNLARQARLVCGYYQSAAEHKRIELFCETEEMGTTACADRIATATVFDNLLSKAVKYSPHGKRVWVRVKAEPGHVVCAVHDEGPGLTPDDQARLFRRGVRLGAVPTGGGSSGYGLAIARDLIERMGGSIRVESVPGEGSTFSFRLPTSAPLSMDDRPRP